MAITKVTRGLLSTGIDDNSDATAITIDSSENVGIGATSMTAKLAVKNATNDSTYTNKQYGVFSPTGTYEDSDLGALVGTGFGELQVNAGQTDRPGCVSIGGNMAAGELIGVLNFYRSTNTDTYRSRACIISGLTSSGTANQYGGDLRFLVSANSATNPGEKMRINTDGEITMQATAVSPFVLNIGGTASDAIRPVNMTVASTAARTQIAFNNPSGNIGSISTTGTATAFNTSSDYRLKENVVTDWDATTRLKQLRPSRFNFISDADTTLDGFLAHEVSDIVPEAITGAKDATETLTNVVLDTNNNVIATNVEEDDWTAGKTGDNAIYPSDSTWEASHTRPVYQSIDQAKLVPLLVKTIQELEARITTLENA